MPFAEGGSREPEPLSYATPPTRVDRTLEWVKRNPTKSTAAGIATVAFVVITALLLENVRARNDLTASNLALAAKTTEAEASAAEALENARVARANEERAEREAAEARRGRDEVLRLSALQKLDDLVAEADRLWPAVPENLPRYEEWLRKARELSAELPDHERKLADLRSKAVPRTEISTRPEWLFTDAQDRWWHNQLEKLVSGVKSFADAKAGIFSDGTSPEHGWGIPRRAEFARTIAGRSTGSSEACARWVEAIGSIANTEECPLYGGLKVTPQLGLLPIGRDPASGLWEFAHLQTGEPAERGADGKLILEEDTGLVFVLLPGGTFQMGGQSADPLGENYDPQATDNEGPVHTVTLSPFFLSKYEMTQGQWSRFVGSNPSYFSAGRSSAKTRITLLHPVEMVSWSMCDVELGRLGLVLPSEAQWEYACRAGTGTPWSPGDTLESLRGYANIADEGSAGAYETGWSFERGFSDGWDVHCPVGALRPNAFGLHEMHGNVWESCQDGYQDYREGPQRDPVSDPSGSANRVSRGGGFRYPAVNARSANRSFRAPSFAVPNLGLRPARALLAP